MNTPSRDKVPAPINDCPSDYDDDFASDGRDYWQDSLDRARQLLNEVVEFSMQEPKLAMGIATKVVSGLIGDNIVGLRESTFVKNGSPTIRWLHIGKAVSIEDPQYIPELDDGLGFDYCSCHLLEDGRRAILCQPTRVGGDDLARLAKLEAVGYEVEISSASPHMPIRTVSVVISTPQESRIRSPISDGERRS